jgi:hypothetical protein
MRLAGFGRLGAGDFGYLSNMLGQPHPRLRQGQPQHLVAFGVRLPRHHHAFFRVFAMILNRPHDTTLQLTQHVENSMQIGAIKYGVNSMLQWRKIGNFRMVKNAFHAAPSNIGINL